jgi:hypothetical protein
VIHYPESHISSRFDGHVPNPFSMVMGALSDFGPVLIQLDVGSRLTSTNMQLLRSTGDEYGEDPEYPFCALVVAPQQPILLAVFADKTA